MLLWVQQTLGATNETYSEGELLKVVEQQRLNSVIYSRGLHSSFLFILLRKTARLCYLPHYKGVYGSCGRIIGLFV